VRSAERQFRITIAIVYFASRQYPKNNLPKLLSEDVWQLRVLKRKPVDQIQSGDMILPDAAGSPQVSLRGSITKPIKRRFSLNSPESPTQQ
jgi:hypothetical protein